MFQSFGNLLFFSKTCNKKKLERFFLTSEHTNIHHFTAISTQFVIVLKCICNSLSSHFCTYLGAQWNL